MRLSHRLQGQTSRSRGQLVQRSAAKCANISQMDKATIFKFGTHIGRGQFLPSDHKLARNWPTVSSGGGILWRPPSRTACYYCYFIILAARCSKSLLLYLWYVHCRPTFDIHCIFIARQHTDTRYWYNNVCPSVRDVLVSDENGLTCCHSFYIVR